MKKSQDIAALRARVFDETCIRIDGDMTFFFLVAAADHGVPVIYFDRPVFHITLWSSQKATGPHVSPKIIQGRSVATKFCAVRKFVYCDTPKALLRYAGTTLGTLWILWGPDFDTADPQEHNGKGNQGHPAWC